MQKNKSTIGWVYEVSGKYIFKVILLALLGAVMSYLSVQFAVVSKNVMDIATGAANGSIGKSVFALSLLILLQICVHIIYTLYEVRTSCRLTNSVRQRLFRILLGKKYMSLGEYHSGELVNRINTDSKAVSDSVMTIIPLAVTLGSQAVFSFYELYRLDKALTGVCLVAFPFVTLAARFYGKKMKPLHKLCLASDGKIKSFAQEIFQNMLAVKAFVKEDLCEVSFGKLQDENYRLRVKAGIISIFANLLFFAVMSFAYYFALMWCASKVHSGLMTVGTLTAILQLIGVMQEPFRRFSSIITGYYTMSASAERLTELENLPSDIADNISDEAVSFEKLCFDKVSFGFGDEEVLSEVDVTVSAGDVVAVTGSSGSGKSTFMKLAMGLISPTDGKVVTYINGRSSEVPERRLFAYVPQGNMILAGTLAENITFFEENPDYEKLRSAASLACLDDCIASLPEGLSAMLGEGGAGLSEGQIQRVAIARALYSQRPVLLLDEATSSLDEATEKEIIDNIKGLKDKTCIIITHRPYSKEIADYELSFEGKKVHVSQNTQ